MGLLLPVMLYVYRCRHIRRTTPLELALRLPKFGMSQMCIVVDICDTLALLAAADIFFTFPPAGPQTKGLVKSLDFPTQL